MIANKNDKQQRLHDAIIDSGDWRTGIRRLRTSLTGRVDTGPAGDLVT